MKKEGPMSKKKHDLPTTGDRLYDGNGGTHFFEEYAIAAPLDSTTDLRLGVAASLSGRTWVALSTLVPPFYVGPSYRSNGPKT